MRINVLSDLHLNQDSEALPFQMTVPDSDIVVMAGNLGYGDHGVRWARQTFQDQPVLYVLGTHEFYFRRYPDLLDQLRQSAAGTDIHILENEAVVLGGVRFLGCTLWTDFSLFGSSNRTDCIAHAWPRLNWFKHIHRADDEKAETTSTLDPYDVCLIHDRSQQWLSEAIRTSSEPIVVVSHHAPTELSIPEEQRGELVTASRASNAIELAKGGDVRLWVHGHVNETQDYFVENTRVVCNPRGSIHRPNKMFDPSFVIEI